jgi:hypothetical protein
MWIIRAWHCISPKVIVKGFKNCCMSNTMDGTDDDICGMGVKRIGRLEVSVRKMKALIVKMGTITPIGKGRLESDMLCVLSV